MKKFGKEAIPHVVNLFHFIISKFRESYHKKRFFQRNIESNKTLLALDELI